MSRYYILLFINNEVIDLQEYPDADSMLKWYHIFNNAAPTARISGYTRVQMLVVPSR